MMVKRLEKCEVTSSNSIASVRGVAHFSPTTLGIFGEPLDHGEGEVRGGPEGIVDDDADLGRGLRRGAHEFLEVGLGVGEVERAGHLDEVEAPSACAALASRTSSSVLVVWPPNASGTRPATSSTTISATRVRSSKVMVEKSPAAPPASSVA